MPEDKVSAVFRLLGIYNFGSFMISPRSWPAGDMCKSSWINDILQMKVGQVSKMNSTTVQSHCKFLWILNMEFSLSNLFDIFALLFPILSVLRPVHIIFW